MPSYRPLIVVSARLLARRWALYLGTCVAALALQVLFERFVHVRLADLYAQLVGPPLVTAVVTVFVGADATGTLTTSERWERISERAWAVIVFDVALSLVRGAGFESMLGSSDPSNVVLGFLVLLLAAMLVYAEPFICLESSVRIPTLLPFAILRSMMLAWVNLPRIFGLFAVVLGVQVVEVLVRQLAQSAHLNPVMWVDLPFATLAAAPLAALFTVAYLDTISQERRSTG